MGCRALAASIVSTIVDIRPDARIYLLYGNRTSDVQTLKLGDKTIECKVVNYRLSPRARLEEHLFWILFLAYAQRVMPFKGIRRKIIQSNRWLRTLEKADFIGEIRGGDSFSDIYGLRRSILGILPCIIAILMRKRLVLLPQTYGPFRLRITKLIARFVLLRAQQIFARDTESTEFVRSLMGQRAKDKVIEFCPDVAFVLETALPKRLYIQPELDRTSSIPLIGLNISGLLYQGGFTRDNMFGLKFDYKDFAPELLKCLLDHTNAHILLVPHVFWGDVEGNEVEVCHELLRSFNEKYGNNKRVHLVMREYDQSELKGILGLCDFFIGSRMHACIAAISQFIPTVGLAYSKKFRGVFRTICSRYALSR
jgi:polysaccharide pyruvyl transferase WcaK-like protein